MANFQVTHNQTLGNQVQNNVTYWQLPDNLAATLQGFVDGLRARYDVEIKALCSTGWTFSGCTLRQMDGGGAFSQEIPFSSGDLDGTDAAARLPYQSALLVSTTVLAAKPNRGRIYFGGLTEASNNSSGQVEATTLDNFVRLVEDMRDGIATGAGNAFLRIARPNFALNDWTLDNPVETVIARTNWASQRRRRPGTGE